jgi:serine phosphatase RsbU (regulator of sigma subunit)
MNAQSEMFGRQRLTDAVLAAETLSAQALCDHIVAAVMAHRGDAPQFDDITLVALRCA